MRAANLICHVWRTAKVQRHHVLPWTTTNTNLNCRSFVSSDSIRRKRLSHVAVLNVNNSEDVEFNSYYGKKPVVIRGTNIQGASIEDGAWSAGWIKEVSRSGDGPTLVEPLCNTTGNTISQHVNSSVSVGFDHFIEHFFSSSSLCPTPKLKPAEGEQTAPTDLLSNSLHYQLRASLQPWLRITDLPPQLLQLLPPAPPSHTTEHQKKHPQERVYLLDDHESTLFFTTAGTRTPLHWDHYENFLLHLVGRKQVVLLRPSLYRTHAPLLQSLYSAQGKQAELFALADNVQNNTASSSFSHSESPPRATCFTSSSSVASVVSVKKSQSEMPPHRPRRAQKQLTTKLEMPNGIVDLQRYVCVLAPGDVLYIPTGWMHDVESETSTVSAALRFSRAHIQ